MDDSLSAMFFLTGPGPRILAFSISYTWTLVVKQAARGLREANRVGDCGGRAKAWRNLKVLAGGKVRQ